MSASALVLILVRPELVEGPFFDFARSLIASKSPRIRAIFFARLEPLIRRSIARASRLVGNSADQTKVAGMRSAVNPGMRPDSCAPMRPSKLSVCPV